MKKLILIVLSSSFIFSACREIMPTIPPIGNPEILSDRKILIEEFTGVGCVNCPAGSKEIENLLGRYPSNLVAISIHGGFFSRPYTQSKYDFRTEDADNLIGTYFGGEPFAYPSATVNRKKSNTGSYYVDSREWPGLIESELEEESQITLSINHDYNPETRIADIEVQLNPKQNIPGDLRITVMILENGVEDYQLLPDPDGWKSDYVHKHILREIVTPFDGQVVDQDGLQPGSTVIKNFNFTLNSEWVAENCDIVAFVHRNTTDTKEVLNADEVHLVK